MTLSTDSAPAKITCLTGTASDSLDCNTPAVNEVVGISFDAPQPGVYEVCGQFLMRIFNPNTQQTDTFSWFETSDTGTELVQGKTRIQQGNNGTSDIDYDTVRVCDYMKFVTPGLKNLRLKFVKAGTSNDNSMYIDRGVGAEGGKNFSFHIRPVAPHQPAPLIISSVNLPAGSPLAMQIMAADVNVSANTITKQYGGPGSGDWIASITNNGTGNDTINFKTGLCSEAVVCTHTCNEAGLPSKGLAGSLTQYDYICRNHAGALVNAASVNIICMCPR